MSQGTGIHAEEGLSLVELLVAVAILGIAFVTILGGMGTAVLISDVHRKQATAGTALREYAEVVEAAAYQECSASSQPAYPYSAPAGFTASMGTVDVWDGNTPAGFGACSSDDPGLQRMRLTVASDDGRATETVQVLKRREP